MNQQKNQKRFFLEIENTISGAKLIRTDAVTGNKLVVKEGTLNYIVNELKMCNAAKIFTRNCITCGIDFCPRQAWKINCSRVCSLKYYALQSKQKKQEKTGNSNKEEIDQIKLFSFHSINTKEKTENKISLSFKNKVKIATKRYKCNICNKIFIEQFGDYCLTGVCDKCLNELFINNICQEKKDNHLYE